MPILTRKPPAGADAGLARAPAGEVARRGLGEQTVPRANWSTIALPTELVREVLEFHVKTGRATSVQEYARFWVRVGSLVDRLLAANPDAATLATALAAALASARDEQ